MNDNNQHPRGVFGSLGDALDSVAHKAARGRWRDWLPSKGNVLFTAVVVAGLLFANRAGALTVYAPSSPQASTNTIAYQGRLAASNGAPLTGVYSMVFRLYSQSSGGAPLWDETWTGPNGVRVSDGLFNVMLGSLTAVPGSVVATNTTLWLGITVGTDGEMAPRVQLGTVPYAMQALTVPDASITGPKIADSSVTASKLAVGSVLTASIGDSSVSTAKLQPGAITVDKLGDASVATAKVQNAAITAEKLLDGSVLASKLADLSVIPRKTKAFTYSQAACCGVNATLTAYDTWVDLSPLSVDIPAADVPVATKALILFNARCRAIPGGMAITFLDSLDGATMSYTDVYPQSGQMLNVGIHDIVTLSANTAHNIRIRWRIALANGTGDCADRRLSVVLLGQ